MIVSPATSRLGLGGAATGKKERFPIRNGKGQSEGHKGISLSLDRVPSMLRVLWNENTKRPSF